MSRRLILDTGPWGAQHLVVAATGAGTGRRVLTSEASAGLGERPGVDALVVRRGG